MVQIFKIFPSKDKEQFIPYTQYHGCWIPGDTSSLGLVLLTLSWDKNMDK